MMTLWITLILLGIAVLYFGLKLLIIWLLWDAAVSKADVLMRALKIWILMNLLAPTAAVILRESGGFTPSAPSATEL